MPILNPDQHKDYSRCMSFFSDELMFMDNVVLRQFVIDIAAEMDDKKTENENEDE